MERRHFTHYRRLCNLVSEHNGTVALHRQDGWGLHVTLRHPLEDSAWRAAGFIFSDLSELELHASILAEWATDVLSNTFLANEPGGN